MPVVGQNWQVKQGECPYLSLSEITRQCTWGLPSKQAKVTGHSQIARTGPYPLLPNSGLHFSPSMNMLNNQGDTTHLCLSSILFLLCLLSHMPYYFCGKFSQLSIVFTHPTHLYWQYLPHHISLNLTICFLQAHKWHKNFLHSQEILHFLKLQNEHNLNFS